MVVEELSKKELTFRPVTLDEWTDLQTLFSEAGVQNGCWCTYWRVKRSEYFRSYGEGNKKTMQRIIESGRVPGIQAYLSGLPIGWCSVAPREDFPVLDSSHTLKRIDNQAVWSIVCFFISKPYRTKGLTRVLIDAAIAYAKSNGAQIVEAYPIIPESMLDPHYERYTGVITTFEKAGFKEVVRRSERRPIMRYIIHD
jgi:GNAT superfamily N-acetyltransferase